MANSPAVIDASIAIKAVLPNPLQAQCQALLLHLSPNDLLAPALWVYETTSAISKAVFFGGITAEEGRTALSQVNALGVQIVSPDTGQSVLAFEWTLRLKRAAAYDSFYLALAEGLNCNLWTADSRLKNGVSLSWVRWVEDISD